MGSFVRLASVVLHRRVLSALLKLRAFEVKMMGRLLMAEVLALMMEVRKMMLMHHEK